MGSEKAHHHGNPCCCQGLEEAEFQSNRGVANIIQAPGHYPPQDQKPERPPSSCEQVCTL